jgi:Zn-dependent protease/predicted transcriptional regulator
MNPTPQVPQRVAQRPAGPTRGLQIGKVFGVEVRLDWSLIVIFALITFNLAAGLFPSWHRAWSPIVMWVTAACAAALFIFSIFLHELAHALAARSQGVVIDRITLFVFGGVSQMRGEPERASSELLIAIVGPLTSFAIGIGASVTGLLLSHDSLADITTPGQVARLMQDMPPVPTLLLWLGPINIALALFNLVPGFPLDGGRVLRSILWAATHDFVKATRWASRCGLVFAWVLMAIGVWNLLTGGWVQGAWLLLIGWFLQNAARASYAQVLLKTTLADVKVSRLMRTQFGRIAPELSLEQFVRDVLMTNEQRAWPIERDGRLEGLVVWDDVRRVPQEQWGLVSVAQVMTPAAQLATLQVGDTADRALQIFTNRDVDQIPVVDEGRLVGLVRRADLLRWYALQQEERHHPGPGFPSPVGR